MRARSHTIVSFPEVFPLIAVMIRNRCHLAGAEPSGSVQQHDARRPAQAPLQGHCVPQSTALELLTRMLRTYVHLILTKAVPWILWTTALCALYECSPLCSVLVVYDVLPPLSSAPLLIEKQIRSFLYLSSPWVLLLRAMRQCTHVDLCDTTAARHDASGTQEACLAAWAI